MPGNNVKHSVKKHYRSHLWAVLLWIFGTLFPPLAVAARFGIGGDFWLNLFLTICGYIPGHVHNFYIQNIRNNKTHARTPKWAVRYGLVDDRKLKRNKKRSEWAHRYNDRNAPDEYEAQPLEDGQIPDRPRERADSGPDQPGLWRPEEERYYSNGNGSSGSLDSGNSRGRWHYPANFDDAEEVGGTRKSKKQDRWARSEDARRGVDDDGRKKKRKKKSSSSTKRNAADDAGSYRGSVLEGPEDAVGGSYGGRERTTGGADGAGGATSNARTGEDNLQHEF